MGSVALAAEPFYILPFPIGHQKWLISDEDGHQKCDLIDENGHQKC